MPITRIASSSSVTRITPICAVMAEPERPAIRIAASTGPSSRISEMPEDVDDEGVGAELPQLLRGEVGQHHADQEAHQRGDRQRRGADVVQVAGEVAPGPCARRRDELHHIEAKLADEARQIRHVPAGLAARQSPSAFDTSATTWRVRSGGAAAGIAGHTLEHCALARDQLHLGGPRASPMVPQTAARPRWSRSLHGRRSQPWVPAGHGLQRSHDRGRHFAHRQLRCSPASHDNRARTGRCLRERNSRPGCVRGRLRGIDGHGG